MNGSYGAQSGGGGTQTAAGSANFSYDSCSDGGFGYGGSSTENLNAGGGYYGGGCSYYYGGGGSGYIGGVTGGSTTAGQQSGNGEAKITFVS